MAFRDNGKHRCGMREPHFEFTFLPHLRAIGKFLLVWALLQLHSSSQLIDRSAWFGRWFCLKPNWASKMFCLEPSPYPFNLHSQDAVTSLGYYQIFEWKPQALDSIPRFHAGNCWWLSLRFSICLRSFPRFHTGHWWWQLQVSIVLGIGLQFSPVRVCCAILSPSLRFRRNWWWCVQGLLWIRALYRLLSSLV